MQYRPPHARGRGLMGRDSMSCGWGYKSYNDNTDWIVHLSNLPEETDFNALKALLWIFHPKKISLRTVRSNSKEKYALIWFTVQHEADYCIQKLNGMLGFQSFQISVL